MYWELQLEMKIKHLIGSLVIILTIVLAATVSYSALNNGKKIEEDNISVTIENPHEIPIVGQDWIVNFKTTGVATLTITAVVDEEVDTTWAEYPRDNLDTKDQIAYLGLFGDGVAVEGIKNVSKDGHLISISYPNWNFSSGTLVNKWLMEAPHTIKFEYGNETAYAHNAPTPTFGSEYTFNSENWNPEAFFSKLTDTKYIITYSDADGYGKSVIATVSGTTVTVNSEYTFQSSSTGYVDVMALTDTTAIIAYRDTSDSDRGKAVVATISGTAVSYGSEYEFSSNDARYPHTARLSDTKFVVSWLDFDTSQGKAVVGTISGSTISYGSVSTWDSTMIMYPEIATLDSTHVVISYTAGDYHAGAGTAIIGSISGTTLSWGSPNAFAGTIYESPVAALSSSSFVVFYSTGTCYARIGSVSGTTITYPGSAAQVSGCTYMLGIDAYDSTRFAVVYRTAAGKANIGDVSGSTITIGTEVQYGSANCYSNRVLWLTDTSFAVSFARPAGATNGLGRTMIGTCTAPLASDGDTCTADGQCTNNNCELGPNTATKYCAAATKECGQSGGSGYDTGNEVSQDECQASGSWLCNAGYYNNGGGTGSCVVAGDDYWSTEDFDTRTQCVANAGTNGTTTYDEATDCNCDAGYYDNDGGVQSCTAVGDAYYSATFTDSRTLCPANSDTAGATTSDAIADCVGDAGYYNCEDGTCDVAGDDYWSADDSNSRTQCTANAGTNGTTTYDEATDCNCDAGYYDNDGGVQSCTAVGDAYYSATFTDSRTLCPSNSDTAGATTSDAITDCVGDAGYYSCTDGNCNVAGDDYWSADNSNSRTQCAANAGTNGTTTYDEATDCNCDASYYDADGGVQDCIQSSAGSWSATFSDSQTACAANTWSPAGSDAAADCTGCLYSGSGDWIIDDGSTCVISTANDIGANHFSLQNGAINITSTGNVIAGGGCYFEYNQPVFIDDDGGLKCF